VRDEKANLNDSLKAQDPTIKGSLHSDLLDFFLHYNAPQKIYNDRNIPPIDNLTQHFVVC
jgi:hypothetical protein